MAFTSFSLSRPYSFPFLSRPYSRFLDHWKPPILPKTPKSLLDYNPPTPSDDDDSTFTTMDRIVQKLKKFGYVDDPDPVKTPSLPEKGSVEDVFYSEDGDLPNGRGGIGEVRFPWEEEERTVERRKERRTSVAELTIPETELRRLRHLAMRLKSKTKIGGGGVTKEVVDKIHEKWRTEEVVRLKCEGPPALNMKRMHEILERKTGGLVIWRSGSSISLYRGVTYEVPTPVKKQSSHSTGVDSLDRYSHNSISSPVEYDNENDVEGVAANAENSENTKATVEVKYEHEMDSLLDGLGPRFTDWPGCDPLPVDADLLPTHIPNYKPPFRILPYGVRPHLGMKDLTALRRLARTLPPHFALGRSRQHQGLAAAMVKLWERSSIAKIALKRGVQLTTSERMAEEIKRLTGGTLLCRNKDFIVFYRGKDFLAPELTEALLERERLARELQDEEEQARVKASLSVFSNMVTPKESSTTGTLTETQEANARWGKQLDHDYKDKMARAADVARHANLVRKLERKLLLGEKRLAKAEKALGKVEEFLKPAEQKPDPDSISDEERYMFRKLGLKMKAFLLLGRRGVFDGTVENMHLHWKYRELVKIIVKAKNFAQVKGVALSLEAESGGILVSVDKVSKGFAVIVYRGRDYQRPSTLRPKNLLTKRKALARSIELQRREALNQHISNMHKRVEQLKSELDQMETVKEHGDVELYAKLDSSYLSVDEDAEDDNDDDDDEAYLETYENDSDYDNGYDNSDDDEEDEQNSGGSLHSVLNRYNHEFSSQRKSPSPASPGSDLQSNGE